MLLIWTSPKFCCLIKSKDVNLAAHMPLAFTTHSQLYTTFKERPFENIVGTVDVGKQHFLFFTPCFLSYKKQPKLNIL